LGAKARDLLVTAAAAGTRFRPDMIAEVHGVGLGEVLDLFVDAASRGLVEMRSSDEYAFLHDRIREALLDGLDTGAAARLHARIAAALEGLPAVDGQVGERTYEIAHHYLLAGESAPAQRALPACVAAGELALRDHAPAKGVVLLEHATARATVPRPRILFLLGSALKQDGQFSAAEQRIIQALELERDRFQRARLFTMLADVYRSVWQTDQAHAAVERGLTEMGAALPRNRFMLVLSTALMLIGGLLLRWTGIRYGTARHEERERCTQITALHEAGGYIGVLGLRFDQLMVHDFRVLYWANRLGTGGQYARGIAGFAFLCGHLGLLRVSRRMFARARADPGNADPAVRAMIAHYQGAAQCMGYRDEGETWKRTLEEHERWLDLAAYGDAVAVLFVDALSQGRTEDAVRWWKLGRRRALGSGDSTSLFIAQPMLAAATGRHAEAAKHMRRLAGQQAGIVARGLTQQRLLAEIYVLTEQNEMGEPFERAVAAFDAVRVPQALIIRPHRTVQFMVAVTRLAQCRNAPPHERAERLRQARRSVRRLRHARKCPMHVARERIARADLLVLEGRPRRALRVLDGGEPGYRPDAPLLAYEAARVRSRALHALDATGEANRQARLAMRIAEEHGWNHRITWVTTEFPQARLDPDPGTEYPRTPTRQTTNATPTRRRTNVEPTVAQNVDRQRLRALEEVGQAASRVVDPTELARITLDELIRILHADRAFLFLTSTGDQLVPHLGRTAAGEDVGELTGYSRSLVERVMRSREPLVVTGTDEGAALGARSAVLHNLRSIMVAPLRLEDRLLGVVYLDSQVAKGIFTADDAGILTALTNYIATSLETARAAQLEISVQTARHERDLGDRLRQAFEAMSGTLDPEAVLAELLCSAGDLLAWDRVWLVRRSSDGDGHLLGETDADRRLTETVLPDAPDVATLLGIDRPVLGPDVAVPAAIAAQLTTAAAWMVLPLRSRTTDLGALVLGSASRTAGVERGMEVASAMVAHGMAAYDNAQLFARVQTLAVVDELTGVANRRRFFELATRDLAAAIRHTRPLAVLMVDIDHFKRVNDTYGHPTGDDVITAVVERITRNMRPTDLLGRYGGEEFVLLAAEADLDGCLLFADRLRTAVADGPVLTRSGPVEVTISIGLTAMAPTDRTLEELIARADQALYEAKHSGRNRACVA
jgi:diguanylate cyclase (GGDEF)-like protein